MGKIFGRTIFIMTLLLLPVCSQATVIYDWVTYETVVGDDQHVLTASWSISEEEYFRRLIWDTAEEIRYTFDTAKGIWRSSTIDATIEGYTLDGDYMTIYGWNRFAPVIYGVLSTDGSRITSMGIYDPEVNCFWPGGISWWNDDGGFDLFANEVRTGMFMYDEFRSIRRGEWLLREETAPAIPEPGTVLLLAAGFIGVVLKRRMC